jgi:hypothetical protein
MASFSGSLGSPSDFSNPMTSAFSYLQQFGDQVPRHVPPRRRIPNPAPTGGENSGNNAKSLKKGGDRASGSKKADRRGRPKKISDEIIQKMIHLLEISDGDVSWEELGHSVGVDGVHLQTIRNYLIKEGYCKRIACHQKWLTKKARETRMQYALAHQHWQNEWHSVLFSNITNFGLGVSHKARVFNRRDERLCEDCLQSREEIDKSVFHCWAMVGYDYKSPLVFYNSESNASPILSPQDYITQILGPHLRPIAATKPIIFLEDASGIYQHSGPSDIVQAYMNSFNLHSIRNPEMSPDLNIVKDVFLLLKKRLQKRTISDEIQLKAAVLEEWDKISFKEINKMVDSMKVRMDKVLTRKGMPT